MTTEIKDKIATLINNGRVNGIPTYEVVDQILSINELAVVNREAELPIRFLHPDDGANTAYRQAQQDMLKADWVQEIK